MTDEQAARAALEAHGFRLNDDSDWHANWMRPFGPDGYDLIKVYGSRDERLGGCRADVGMDLGRIPALLAALDDKPAKRVCPACEGEKVEQYPLPVGVGDSISDIHSGTRPCGTCHGIGKVDPPTDAQLLRTAALWMMHLSLDRLPAGGDAATKTERLSADLRRLAARLEQDPSLR